MSRKREWGKSDDMGTITSPVDCREDFGGLWPIVCEAPSDCREDVAVRVRMGDTLDDTWYLCATCATLPQFATPAKDRDWLGERINE